MCVLLIDKCFFEKVEAIIGKIDEAIMNFEKVSKDATGANIIRSFLRTQFSSYMIFTGPIHRSICCCIYG